MNFILRTANFEDLHRITNLRLKFLQDMGKIKYQEEYRLLYEKNHSYMYDKMKSDKLIIPFFENGIDNEIISIGIGVILDKPPINMDNLGFEGYIFNVCTDEKFRKRGYSTMILNEIINFFRKKDIKNVTLKSNEKSFELYKKNGFNINNYYMELTL